MRMRGSFAHAIETLCIARTLGITTGVTSTVTADNAQDLPDLAQLVSRYGVRELKLHQLRIVGNARTSQLQTAGKEQLSQLINWIKSGETHLKVIYDDDLDPSKSAVPSASANRGVLDRIEVDPDLGFTMSCKAVGTNAQAFYWSPKLNTIEYRPSQMDEVQCPVPNVNYA